MTSPHTNLLIVDDDEALVKVFTRLAKEQGWSCDTATSGNEAIEKLACGLYEVAVVDITLPGYTGIQVLEYAKQNRTQTEIVMITGRGTIESSVQAMKKGAYDYLTKPFEDIERVVSLLEKAMERYRMVQEIQRLERQRGNPTAYEKIVGRSQKMQEVFSLIDSIAAASSTVLIEGESGTGKELVARAIHSQSKRADKPLVVINCAAIPEQLLESELFGHRKGAFTGAVVDRKGLFEEAHKGTVFLDEIGELPISLQVKLLRVLQEGEIRRVGDSLVKKIDVRLVAATNRELAALVKEGNFREDLFYRLNVINVRIPPLRERIEDIPLLAYHFLEVYTKKANKKIENISVDAMQALQSYTWSGNVRELENVIQRAVVLAMGTTVAAQDLPPKVLGKSFYISDHADQDELAQLQYQDAKSRALVAFNRAYINNLLKMSNGNVSVASSRAGMDRSNFKKLIKRYHIDVGLYRGKRRGVNYE